MPNVIVIGGGAAGMMAAVGAARAGAKVTLLEKNEKLGKKIFITGKGRCNLTNACDGEELLNNVMSNRRFLYSAFHAFSNFDVIDFFEELGMRTKIERGNRVFPVSDHAYDVTDALSRALRKEHVTVCLKTEVKGLVTSPLTPASEETRTGGERADGVKKKKKKPAYEKVCTGVKLTNGTTMPCDRVIVCTGGLSYPTTGSTGDGFRFAKEQGLEVTKLQPSLCSIRISEPWCAGLSGLSLKNVEVSFYENGENASYRAFGEMLFTLKGVSGPIILSATAELGDQLNHMKMKLDLKPALTTVQLDNRLVREIEGNRAKALKNLLPSLVPSSFAPVLAKLSGIDETKPVGEITKEERAGLVSLLKGIPMQVTGLGGYSEAVITKGGVSVDEISASSCETKRIKGLYFAGEVLDLDAMTGGYNLQIAWSTGMLAGAHAAKDFD